MNKYVFIFIAIISCLFVAGIYLFGVRYGRYDCERNYQQAQITIVESITKEEELVQETVNSADLNDIRRLLCETARDNCGKERTDNSSANM